MNDDLIKRLRKGDPFSGVMQQAADRIEALEAVLTDMRDDKIAFRHPVHFRRRAAVVLAGSAPQEQLK